MATMDNTSDLRVPRQIDKSGSDATHLIKVRHLIREYQAGNQTIRVLDDINMDIQAGEMVAIIGQSGSGKSTLMNILGCLDQPTAGQYHIMGQDTRQMSANALAQLRREYFGFIFQRYQLLTNLSALDNVVIPAVYMGIPATIRQQKAADLLGRLGLQDRLKNKPGQLSGGQQQRVSIARALINGGKIILADEPTGALDSQSGQEVMQILSDLNQQGHTVIIVTHDPEIARQANRIVEIKDGRIISDQTAASSLPNLADEASTAQDHTISTPAHTVPLNSKLDSSTKPYQTNQPSTLPLTHTISRVVSQFQEAFKMAIISMNSHRLRTLLTMLGIIIGIAAVVSVVAIGKGSQQKILSDISALGTNSLTVIDGYPWGDPRRRRGMDNLTPADALAVANQPYTQHVSPQLDTNAKITFANISEDAAVSGVGINYFAVTGEQIALGQGFDQTSIDNMTQDLVIDANALRTFFKDIDNPIGQVVLVGQIPARVIGVLEKKETTFGNDSDTPTVYLPYTTVMRKIQSTNYLERFVVALQSDVSSQAAEQAITDLIRQRHGKEDFRIFNADSIKKTVESTTATFTLLVSSIAIISLIVGGIGVMNIMLVSVTERTSEIGVRMAVGARQSDIMQQFLIEAVLVCVIGGALGIALAFGIGWGLLSLAGDKIGVVFSTTAIVGAFVCATLIGIVFGFLPARNAARLNPVDALSRE